MRFFILVISLSALIGCASDGPVLHGPQLLGAPEIIRPQEAPAYMRSERRAASYRVGQVSASTQVSVTTPVVARENLVISLDGENMSIPVRPASGPTLNLGVSQSPVVSTAGLGVEPRTALRNEVSRGAQIITYEREIPVVEAAPRNPSFNVRRPIAPPVLPVYQPLSAAELLKRVELAPRFRVDGTDWAAPVDRWLGNAATILRSNPRAVIRVTGFATSSEAGGRDLALARAERVAEALRRRGVGSARIETEGKLVILTRVPADRRPEVAQASQRAQIRVISGRVDEDPFRPNRIPPLESVSGR